jgi:protein involved in plasmid replication-relaxation
MKKDTPNLTKRDLEAIYGIGYYKFLSSFQLAYLYFPDSIHENATRRLTTLTNHRFISRVFSYPKATDDPKGGHPTAVYYWTPENKRRLQQHFENRGLAELFSDYEPLTPTDNNNDGISQLYLVHEIGISDFFLSLEEATHCDGWTILFWERTSPFSKELKALVPPLTATITRRGKDGTAIKTTEMRPFNPDAIFLLEDPDQQLHFGFLEYDNNTASPEKFNKKLEGYITSHNQNLFPAVLDYYIDKYALDQPKGNIGFRVFTATANIKGDHRRRNDLLLASLAYKRFKLFYYASITDCTPENILSPIWLRGKEYPEAKAHLTQILPPEASLALQRRTHHETLNNPELMPRVSLVD